MTHQLWKQLYEELGSLDSEVQNKWGALWLNRIAFATSLAKNEKDEERLQTDVLKYVIRQVKEVRKK